jgi:hypothetical protein
VTVRLSIPYTLWGLFWLGWRGDMLSDHDVVVYASGADV